MQVIGGRLVVQHNDQGMQQTCLRGQLNDYPKVVHAKHLIGRPIEGSIAIRNVLMTYMKLHDVATEIIYFYLIIDEDNNRKNDGRKIVKRIMQG
jgi:hypothetical protein